MPPKPLRVLMISSDRNIFREGSEVRERMKEYASLAEELHIIVFSRKKDGYEKTNITENCVAYPSDSWTRWRYISDARNLGERLFFGRPKGSEINLITAQDPFETGLAGYYISRKIFAPLHLQIHTDFLSPAFQRGSWLNAIRVLIAKFLLQNQANVRVVSERIRTSILEKMKFGWNRSPRITVLPVFVDAEKIRQAPITVELHKKYPFLGGVALMVGRLEREKNVLLALRLLKKIYEKGISASLGLIIIGDGSEREALQKYAKNAGVDKNVFFLGWQDDVASYYKTADLLLVTSDYEGYGRMFVEAQAAGCPVLTHDIGAAKEILKSWNSIICDEGDEICLYHTLARLASDADTRSNFKAAAHDGAKRLVFETKEEYLAKYKKMWLDAATSKDFDTMT